MCPGVDRAVVELHQEELRALEARDPRPLHRDGPVHVVEADVHRPGVHRLDFAGHPVAVLHVEHVRLRPDGGRRAERAGRRPAGRFRTSMESPDAIGNRAWGPARASGKNSTAVPLARHPPALGRVSSPRPRSSVYCRHATRPPPSRPSRGRPVSRVLGQAPGRRHASVRWSIPGWRSTCSKAGWAFRRRHWCDRAPFLPVPDRDLPPLADVHRLRRRGRRAAAGGPPPVRPLAAGDDGALSTTPGPRLTRPRPRVVIVGGGFAGLYAAKALRTAPGAASPSWTAPTTTSSSRCCTRWPPPPSTPATSPRRSAPSCGTSGTPRS